MTLLVSFGIIYIKKEFLPHQSLVALSLSFKSDSQINFSFNSKYFYLNQLHEPNLSFL